MSEKPPIGLRPRCIAEGHRVCEILDAMKRYVEAGYTIPQEWLVELLDLLRRPEHELERLRKVAWSRDGEALEHARKMAAFPLFTAPPAHGKTTQSIIEGAVRHALSRYFEAMTEAVKG